VPGTSIQSSTDSRDHGCRSGRPFAFADAPLTVPAAWRAGTSDRVLTLTTTKSKTSQNGSEAVVRLARPRKKPDAKHVSARLHPGWAPQSGRGIIIFRGGSFKNSSNDVIGRGPRPTVRTELRPRQNLPYGLRTIRESFDDRKPEAGGGSEFAERD